MPTSRRSLPHSGQLKVETPRTAYPHLPQVAMSEKAGARRRWRIARAMNTAARAMRARKMIGDKAMRGE